MSHADDEKFSALAIEQAAKCVPEDGAKPRPRVGAVLVAADGEILGSSFRGEKVEPDQKDGDHAEYVLLGRKLRNHDLRGATLYTTLEPCVKRSKHKTPCAKRVIDAGISRVVIGMLDPNPDITGRGYWQLRRAAVRVALFPPEAQPQVEDQNSTFADPYRRFDNVFVSELLGRSAMNAAGLLSAVRLAREYAPQLFETHGALIELAEAGIVKELRESIEHLDAMGSAVRQEIQRVVGGGSLADG